MLKSILQKTGAIALLAILLIATACSSGKSAYATPTATYQVPQPTSIPTIALPRSGHWQGSPAVSIDIVGNSMTIKMVVPIGKRSTCTISTSVTLRGFHFYTLAISGTFSDAENVSGDYTVVTCGGLLPTPARGSWTAHWVSSSG